MIKISIISVVYNAEKKIKKTIESVISQDYPNIEYIVIDGNSLDGTVRIIREYQDRIEKWVSEPDDGIYYAMNKGLGVATGDYVYFLNAGDVLKKGVISQIVQYLSICDVDVIYGDIEKERLGRYRALPLESVNWIMPLSHPAVFIKRKIHGLFDTEYRIAADYKKIKELYNSGFTFAYVPVVVSWFEEGGISDNLYNRNKERTSVACKMLKKQDKNYELHKKILLDNYLDEQFELMMMGFNRTDFTDCFYSKYIQKRKKIICFGTGELATRCEGFYQFFEKEIAYFVDNNPQKWNKKFKNHMTFNPDRLKDEKDKCVFVLNDRNSYSIKLQLNEMQLDTSIEVIEYRDLKSSFIEEYQNDIIKKGINEIPGFKEIFNCKI